jgi:predicted dehydrogenase
MKNMKKIRIAIAGMGSRGRFLAQSIQSNQNYELTALIDTDGNNLQGSLAHISGEVDLFQSLEKALKEGDFEAIAITTPDYTHAAVAVPCFAHGKHVMCEKPLEITMEGCEQIIEAHQRSGKVLLIGFVLRYVRKLQKMHDLIASGAIGKPIQAYANHEVPEGSRWYFHDWHALRKYSTGLLLQKGSHDIDVLNWLIGQRPIRVMASGGLDVMGGHESEELDCQSCGKKSQCADFTNHIDHFPDLSKPISCVYRKSVDVEDNHLVIIEYDGGARASYSECHFSPYPRRSFCVIGTKGRIEILDDDKIQVTKRFPVDTEIYKVAPVEGGHDGGDTLILEDFYNAIINNETPAVTAEDGKISVEVAIAAHRSMREKKIIELPVLRDKTIKYNKDLSSNSLKSIYLDAKACKKEPMSIESY